MICLKLNGFFYGLSHMLQFSKFVWALIYSAWNVFNRFLLIDATDRSKISSNQKRFFIALRLYPLSFFANTPFKGLVNVILSDPPLHIDRVPISDIQAMFDYFCIRYPCFLFGKLRRQFFHKFSSGFLFCKNSLLWEERLSFHFRIWFW